MDGYPALIDIHEVDDTGRALSDSQHTFRDHQMEEPNVEEVWHQTEDLVYLLMLCWFECVYHSSAKVVDKYVYVICILSLAVHYGAIFSRIHLKPRAKMKDGLLLMMIWNGKVSDKKEYLSQMFLIFCNFLFLS